LGEEPKISEAGPRFYRRPSDAPYLCMLQWKGMEKPLRFSRKHRIGKASARYVIEHGEPTEDVSPQSGARERTWEGLDDRGRPLEIVAVEFPDCWMVVHVMPTDYRRRKP
jgi:hypothetical protein